MLDALLLNALPHVLRLLRLETQRAESKQCMRPCPNLVIPE